MIPGLTHDLRYGLRGLWRTPGFSVVAVLTIALGIGATTSIFSVVNAVLLRPLPYAGADRLIEILPTAPGGRGEARQLSFPNFRDLRDRSHSFSQLGAFRFWLFSLAGSREPETVLGVYASEQVLSSLGVQPALGRGFSAESDTPGRAPEVLLSHGLWRRQFAGDAGVLGKTVSIDGLSVTVVGVLPADFRFPDLIPTDAPLPSRSPDLIVPMGLEPFDRDNRGNANYWVIGRLAAGGDRGQVQREVSQIAGQLAKEFPDNDAGMGLVVASLKERVLGDAAGPLLFLLGAVGFVLLIACTNVTGLLLARASARRREFALRAALGATPGRMARQVLTESLLLAVLGGGLGALFGFWGVDVIRYAAPSNTPRLAEVTVDGRILGFTLLVSLLTGVLFGLSPALGAMRRSAGETLK